MKFLFDLLPVILFFVTFKLFDDPIQGALAATAVAMATAGVQIAVAWWRHRKVERMLLVTFVLIMVLGGLSLLFHDPVFFMWKPTAVNWLFALAFLGSRFIGDRPLVQRALGHALALPGPVWRRLNDLWTGFFALLGGANLYVAYNFELDTWVNFKLYGMLGLTLAFVVAQALYLARHVHEPGRDAAGRPEDG